MSYRLISSNDIAIKYPEVNDMPCIYADLPNGMDGEHYVLEQEPKTGHWIGIDGKPSHLQDGMTTKSVWCSLCGKWLTASDEYSCFGNYCPNCGARMVVDKLRGDNE